MEIVVGITGASGVVYAVELLKKLKDRGEKIHLIVSENGEKVLRKEVGLKKEDLKRFVYKIHRNEDLESPIASGQSSFEAVVIVPCSMKTLAGIANGYTQTLIERVVDVALKERRKVIVVPRETPLNLIHLRNMERIAEAGAIILPAMPAFYNKPSTLLDLVQFLTHKIERILYEEKGN